MAIVSRLQHSFKAQVKRVISVSVANHRGLTLEPGVDDRVRRIHVDGAIIKDVPVRFTINGLEAYELPVIGKYCNLVLFVEFVGFLLIHCSLVCPYFVWFLS